MTTTPHPYAHILRAIAEGLNVQWQTGSGKWIYQPVCDTLAEISRERYSPGRYRVAPRTININGHEVPEPLRELPPDGLVYYIHIEPGNLDCLAQAVSVDYYKEDLPVLLKMGLLHSTREAALAHALALISFTEVK